MAKASSMTRAATAAPTMPPDPEGRLRAVIEGVAPEIDGGRFAISRVVGETVRVECDAFTDGHDVVRVELRHRPAGGEWSAGEMEFVVNDRWRGEFAVDAMGVHEYTLRAWVDHFATWQRGLGKKVEAGQDVSVDLLVGASLVTDAAGRAEGADRQALLAIAERMAGNGLMSDRASLALDASTTTLTDRHPDRSLVTEYPRVLRVRVDRERARFSTWYELFPRSLGASGQHGTLRDVIDHLDYVADLGFDVLYLPPIHPIGVAHRKGPNNAVTAADGDHGSPWAIGGSEGGHDAIHPDLGTRDDLRALVKAANAKGIDLALDLALQCAPDHPWVAAHPEWFKHRPDGTVQYAENPPKKYQDIYPIDFETDDWQALWRAIHEVVMGWVDDGVRVLRVDNPHTKPFAFWEWLIAQVQSTHPDVIFLAEAFTRPKVMKRLAKLGFTQSYTYFAWRNTRHELAEYFTELTRTEQYEYFRPNVWPNTPDILTEHLQYGGRPAFISRLVLAGTLAASYGIYGPAFELGEHVAREPGSEEYLDSEKYQLRDWDRDAPHSIAPIIRLVNRARHEHPALQTNANLVFHGSDNDRLLVYSKTDPAGGDTVLCIVNVDPYSTASGWTHLDLGVLGLGHDEQYQVHDILGGGRFLWQGAHNYVQLDPHVIPAHIFVIRHRARTENDFDYFL